MVANGDFGHRMIGYFAEGQNVAIEFRWAETRYDRLPAMAAELTRLPVSVIAVRGGNPAVDAAKAATNTIPVVFVTGSDPLREGWVTSLNRPVATSRARRSWRQFSERSSSNCCG